MYGTIALDLILNYYEKCQWPRADLLVKRDGIQGHFNKVCQGPNKKIVNLRPYYKFTKFM